MTALLLAFLSLVGLYLLGLGTAVVVAFLLACRKIREHYQAMDLG
ncbi:MAG TPA: hypothetical protein VGS07_10430 [Thermoanaerobaculia bacterium]|jgi:hypothetical protein|nr:hypothetical protein [Thermoanaerobaculia bacterium]